MFWLTSGKCQCILYCGYIHLGLFCSQMSDFESQQDEVEALQSIFTEEEFHSFQDDKTIRGEFNAFVSVPEGYTVYHRKIELPEGSSNHEETQNTGENKSFEKSTIVQHLPPIQLSFKLPADYPSKSPPYYTIACPWLRYSQVSKQKKMGEKKSQHFGSTFRLFL